MCRFHAGADESLEVTACRTTLVLSILVLSTRHGRDSAPSIGAQPGSAKTQGGDKITASEMCGHPISVHTSSAIRIETRHDLELAAQQSVDDVIRAFDSTLGLIAHAVAAHD